MLAESTVLMDRVRIAATVRSLALAISDANPDFGALVLLGILRRGGPGRPAGGAHRRVHRHDAPVGSLATTMYRDDVRTGAAVPQMKGETHFDFSVDDRTLLLVDDVRRRGARYARRWTR
jgi:pyrimidine operon attenuation protein/uracil phosphoribosyltransferase